MSMTIEWQQPTATHGPRMDEHGDAIPCVDTTQPRHRSIWERARFYESEPWSPAEGQRRAARMRRVRGWTPKPKRPPGRPRHGRDFELVRASLRLGVWSVPQMVRATGIQRVYLYGWLSRSPVERVGVGIYRHPPQQLRVAA